MNHFRRNFDRYVIWTAVIVVALCIGTAHAAVSGQWRVNLLRGTTTLSTEVGATQEEAWATCQARIKAQTTAGAYTCQTPRYVATVTPDPLPTCTPPKPADEMRAVACPAGTVGQWSQTRTYSCAGTTWTASAWAPSTAPAGACPAEPGPNPDPSVGMFTDLASAPECANVTIYPAKTVVAATAAGIPIHQGRCLEATPATFTAAFWAAVQPGDVVTLRAGTYTQRFGEGTWFGGETFKKGTATQPIAVVAAPGEKVVMSPSGRPPLMFGNGSQSPKQFAEYLTFAGIDYIGAQACISGGGDSTNPAGGPDETGGRFIRIVGGSCTLTDATSNTMTGFIDLGNDGWKVLGMAFHDPANRVVINNNHGVYIQGGADDVEIAFNQFVGIHTGHVVQIHQDGTPKLYERLSVHDNYFRATNYNDMRGISVVNVADGSTISLVRNHLEHLGWDDWGCLNTYGGLVTVDQMECIDTHDGVTIHGQSGGDHYGGAQRQIVMSNSKICPSAGTRTAFVSGATPANLTETGAKACP